MNTSGIEHLLHQLEVWIWWASAFVVLGVALELVAETVVTEAQHPQWKRLLARVSIVIVLLGVSGETVIQVLNSRKTEQYRELLRGRTLTADAKARMAALLGPFHGHSIDILAYSSDLEAVGVAESIGNVLVDAFWDVGAYLGSGDIVPLGMQVAVKTGADVATQHAALALDSALRCASLVVVRPTWFKPDDWPPISSRLRAFANHDATAKGDIRLYIGTDPR